VATDFKEEGDRVDVARGLAATHCNAQQCTATHYNTMQLTVAADFKHRSNWVDSAGVLAMQHTAPHATHCNTLQHTATNCNALQHTVTLCNTLQYSAAHCSTLLHAATHSNTTCSKALQLTVATDFKQGNIRLDGFGKLALQHTATHCNTLQLTLAADFKQGSDRVDGAGELALQHTATHWNALQHTTTHCSSQYPLILND